MADRTVSYSFRANFGQFTAGLAAMGRSVQSVGTQLTALDANGQRMRAGLTTVGAAAGKIGLVAAAGVAVAVRAAANFEQAMSEVQAATHETAENMNALRDAALEAGAKTQFSATEAAGAVENLAKAGISTADILGGGLTGALDLAAAGGLEVADAAEIAATALTQFRLSGEDVPHVADLLAAGAGKAQGEVSDLAMALKQGGLVAAQMGISVEETTGVLAEFAAAGLLGSDAGTSLKTMLLRLANPAAESAKLMKSLGINAYDAQGNFVGLEALAGQLTTAFEGKTQAERDSALATIFGSDAIRAASVLYQGGAQSVADWTNKVNDSGYAAETAKIKMDNLKGDLEQLGGALETALIGAGSGSQGPLRDLVQGLTKTVNAFNALPGPAQSAATGMLAVTAILGASVWAGTKVIAGITAVKGALAALGIQAETTRAKLSLVAGGGAAAALGLGTLLDMIDRMDSMGRTGDVADASLKSVQDLQDALDFSNVAKYADDLHINLGRLSQDLLNNAENGEYVRQVLEDLGDTQQGLGALFGGGAGEILPFYTGDTLKAERALDDLQALVNKSSFADFRDDLFVAAGATDDAAGAMDGYAGSVEGATEANNEARQAIRDAMDAMREQREEALASFDAITQYRQAVKDAAKQAKESEAGIKGSSDEALENRNRLSSLAGAWNDLDNKTKNATGAFKAARDNFIQTATAMGVPKEAARKLANELLDLPKQKVIPVSTPGVDESKAKLQALKGFLDSLRSKTITVTVNQRGGVTSSGGGRSQQAADDPAPPPPDPKNPKLGRTNNDLLSGLGPRLRGAGLNTVTVAPGVMRTAANQQSTLALNMLAREANKAGEQTGGLKKRLSELEKKLDKVTNKADKAGDALESLVGQRDSLSSSVSQALLNDPFQGGLSEFAAQTAADKADAEAMLTALQTILGNGVDPKSAFFQQLAASGNVSLAQQFATLTRGDLATYAASFTSSRDAAGAAGAFTGEAAFGAAIKQQQKVVDKFDGSVSRFEKAIKDLEAELKQRSGGGGGQKPGGGQFMSSNVATTPKKFGGR